MNKPTPRSHFIHLLFIVVVTTFYSCDEDVICPPQGGAIGLSYLHNDQNAIFGPHAIIDQDSISFINLNHPEKDTDFLLVDSIMSIVIFLKPGSMYVLQLGKSHYDTFQMTMYLQPLGRHCSSTLPQIVEMNGAVLCEHDCEEVIEIEF